MCLFYQIDSNFRGYFRCSAICLMNSAKEGFVAVNTTQRWTQRDSCKFTYFIIIVRLRCHESDPASNVMLMIRPVQPGASYDPLSCRYGPIRWFISHLFIILRGLSDANFAERRPSSRQSSGLQDATYGRPPSPPAHTDTYYHLICMKFVSFCGPFVFFSVISCHSVFSKSMGS